MNFRTGITLVALAISTLFAALVLASQTGPAIVCLVVGLSLYWLAFLFTDTNQP